MKKLVRELLKIAEVIRFTKWNKDGSIERKEIWDEQAAAKEIAKVSKLISGASLGPGFKNTYQGYEFVRTIRANRMAKGKIYGMSYKGGNQGQDIIRLLGYSDVTPKYGDGGVVFNTLKDVKKKYGVKNMRELEKIDDKLNLPYGHGIYMWVESLPSGSKGPWYYPFNGRWSRGSGAEKITFWEVKKA